MSSTNANEGDLRDWKTVCSIYSTVHGTISSISEVNSKAACCDAVQSNTTPTVISSDVTGAHTIIRRRMRSSDSKLLLASPGCPSLTSSSGGGSLDLPSVATSVISIQTTGLSWSHMVQCQHLNACSLMASSHFS